MLAVAQVWNKSPCLSHAEFTTYLFLNLEHAGLIMVMFKLLIYELEIVNSTFHGLLKELPIIEFHSRQVSSLLSYRQDICNFCLLVFTAHIVLKDFLLYLAFS